MLNNDPAIERIRKIRHRISQECDHDPQKVVDYYIELQKKYKNNLLKEPEDEHTTTVKV